jgi:hypothetical protein
MAYAAHEGSVCVLVVSTLLWDKNEHTHPLSGSYDESWVEKLYRGFQRNLSIPFKFVLFTERKREFSEPIEQVMLSTKTPDFSNCIEPYQLSDDHPMILVGLDTVIVGDINCFADWCMRGDKIALLRDAKSYRLRDQGYPEQSINGVQFAPKGWRRIYDDWKHGMNDMHHMRKYPWVAIDDKWGRETVVSYKMQVRNNENRLPTTAKICYFHGQPKMDSPQVNCLPWMQKHWR